MLAGRSLIIVNGATALAEAAVARLVKQIETTEGEAAVCLTGGSSPRPMYEMMAQSPWRERIPWSRVHWFMGDDRFVPHDNVLSNSGMAERQFLDVCAPADHVHMIDTGLSSPDESAADYEWKLRMWQQSRRDRPLFDLVLMGVGSDGHTASLFPGTAASREVCRWVVGVPAANVEPFVPRVSLTLRCLSLTREMLFLGAGAEKKVILERVCSGEDLPAARAFAAGGETVWLLDEDAVPANARSSKAHSANPIIADIVTIIVMGVSGSGKSTIAAALAERLGFDYEDGDDYHSQVNIDKMHAGTPLTDEDRWSWLRAIADVIAAKVDNGRSVVVACSALKRTYRDILVRGRDDVRIVYLKGSRDLMAERLKGRKGHFVNPSLLDSQFETLEEPAFDEPAVTVEVDRPVAAIIRDILDKLDRYQPVGD
jgi:6-phosphogluconolactonase